MLPIVLVLLVASSAFAAPSVSVSVADINEIAPAGLGSLGGITSRALELVDGADTNIYILTVEQILGDLASQGDPASQASAVAQILAVVGELASGIPGDACEAAAAIDSYASGRGGGAAIGGYLGRLASNIDLISQLSLNPNSLRYSSGPRANCAGSGRTYQFEAAWDAILDRASPYSIGLVNEEYCAAKRLYNAFSARSNNVGAAVTAASLPPVVSAVQNALGPLTNFLSIAASGGNASQAAAVAKSALLA